MGKSNIPQKIADEREVEVMEKSEMMESRGRKVT